MSSARSRLPFVTFLAPAALAFAAAPPTSSQDNAAAVYNDSASFGKISNAAQNALIARFGARLFPSGFLSNGAQARVD